jgi:hypothetical protein
MLYFLFQRASKRKLRLFAAACCRRIWDRLEKEDGSRHSVEYAELVADGLASPKYLPLVRSTVANLRGETACVWSVTDESAFDAAVGTVAQREESARQAQAALFFDIFGNPFRPASTSPSWLSWNSGAVVKLAQAAYDERHLPAGSLDNGRLAILADALEEAGCPNQDILGHCRSGGEHVRGCWAVDAILGKT